MAASVSPRILYNQYQGRAIEGEAFIADHIFSYIVSGAHDVWVGDKLYSFQAGDYRFFRRNQLAKSLKKPLGEGFCSVSVHINEITLREIGRQYDLTSKGPHLSENVLLLKPGRYLECYVDSLLPYVHTEHALREHIGQLKARELVLILLESNPSLANLLFDFSEPGKIDLQGFMNKHYRYNVTLDRLAFLTGRSLSGFKRDFAKLYGLTPSRWLVRQRLLEAHYLIEKKGKRPSDIYLEIGFNDLSHFSYAYKKAFGNAPGKLGRG
ncbi:AraC-type DNA-binding protein [Dyadobacter soli]|uniref:AraC-type DNA-binding protein n=2 Tax=Dyadobacter soli TaxID=659014 RepID=A0A1G7S9E1_9BACT|nr:AraC-type DNA-binding protein [Dyadobacter soli]